MHKGCLLSKHATVAQPNPVLFHNKIVYILLDEKISALYKLLDFKGKHSDGFKNKVPAVKHRI